MFVTILTVVHITVCIFLVVIVLLQHGKGADIGATFGGAGNTVFGARGAATVLSKITIASAVLFMVTSMSLAVMATKQTTGSVFEEEGPVPTAPGMGAAPEESAAPAESPTDQVTTDEAGAEVSPGEEAAGTEQGAQAQPSDENSTAPSGDKNSENETP